MPDQLTPEMLAERARTFDPASIGDSAAVRKAAETWCQQHNKPHSAVPFSCWWDAVCILRDLPVYRVGMDS